MSQSSKVQYLKEPLSALIDGEVTEMELRRLLAVDDEQFDELRRCWMSYQVAASGAKKDVPVVPYKDLSAQISSAIANEPAHEVVKETPKTFYHQMWAGVVRFAVAASVAGAVVLGVQFSPNSTTQQVVDVDPPPATQRAVPSSFENGLPKDTSISTVSNESRQLEQKKRTIIITEGTQKKLEEVGSQVNRLMFEHAQNASQNTQQGVLSYKRPDSSGEQ